MSDHPLDLAGADGDHPLSVSGGSSSYHRNNTELPTSNMQSEDALDQFGRRYGTSANVVHFSQPDMAAGSRREVAGDGGGGLGPGRLTSLQHAREQQLQLLQLRVEHAQRLKEQRRELRHLEYEKKVQAKTAHRFPPVGTVALCGCGMSTIALSYPNTGHFVLNPTIPAMQIAFAGITQLIVAILEWINGATVMYSIFSTYAAFHLTIGLMLIMPHSVKYMDLQVAFYDTRGYQPVLAPVSEYLLGTYLLLFAIWTIVCIAVAPLSTVGSTALLVVVFLTYFLQAIANMVEFTPLLHAGAYFGIISGGGMMYIGLAEVINFVYGRELVPLIAWNRVPGCLNYRAMQRKRQEAKAQEARLVELQQREMQAQPDHGEEGHAHHGHDLEKAPKQQQPRIKRMLHLDSHAEGPYL